jgi:ubiquinone/menaquinone biosynthesis C-methylase UbiE
VGCGSGPNFSLLVEAVGPSGQVIGFDLSPDMVHAANARIEKHTWVNVSAFEASAENVELGGCFALSHPRSQQLFDITFTAHIPYQNF